MTLDSPNTYQGAVEDGESSYSKESLVTKVSASVQIIMKNGGDLSCDSNESGLAVPARRKHAATFLEYSDLEDAEKARAMEAFLALADSIEISESDPYKAGQAVKRHLRKAGWEYNDEIYKLDEILKTKSGNCAGLTLLVGAILEHKGMRSDYAILTDPTDAVSREDAEVLDDLKNGDYFQYDHPRLFSLKRWEQELSDRSERPNRFGLAEHPVMVHGNYILETTNFNTDDDEGWQPEKCGTSRVLTYEQLASTLTIEKLRRDPLLYKKLSDEKDRNTILAAVQRSLNIWPENYDACQHLCMIARYLEDKELEQKSLARFKDLHSENARYYYMLYILTNDLEHLRKCRALCPTAIPVHLECTKRLITSKQEQKFNLAIASYMVALSSERRLVQFYEDEREFIEATYGEDYYLNLMDGEI